MSERVQGFFSAGFALVLMLAAPFAAADTVNTGTDQLTSNVISQPIDEPIDQSIDQLIIKYRPDIQSRMSRQTFQAMAARTVSGVVGQQVQYKRPMAASVGAHVLKLPYSMSPQQASIYAQQIMQQNPQIDYVEPDFRRYIQRTVTNDTSFNQQWHLLAPEDFTGAANVVNAWDVSKGKAEIVVAVLDGGMTNHEDLRPAFVGGTLAESGYDMMSEAADSGDGDGRDSDPSNPGASGDRVSEWHGTHVGGIIAARPDNGKFVAGVGWNTSLLVVRIFSEDIGGYLSDQVDGMLWAAGESVPGVADNPHPAHVLNMSVGSDVEFDCSRTEQSAVNTIRDKGISVVVAAGNLNKNVEFYAPGNCKGVIAVTGVMRDGARAPYANYGELIDIAAPGDEIYSTINTGNQAPAEDDGKTISGTSQAAPQVSGVIALMLAANENLLDTRVIKRADLVALIENKLRQSVRPFPVMVDGEADALGCRKNQDDTGGTACVCTTATCGAGLLDAFRALKAVTTQPQINPGEDREVAGGATVQLGASGSSDDDFGGEIVRYQWEQLSGPEVTLENSEQSVASFVAPAARAAGQVLRFKITATDDVGLQGSRQVAITVLAADDGDTDSESGGGGSLPLWVLCVLMMLLWGRRLVVSDGD